MDRDFAIERYRGRLLALVLTLFAEIGLTEGGMIERVSKPLYRFVLRRLRTAESAVRRLIIAAARDIVVEPRKARPAKSGNKTASKAKAAGEAKAESKGKNKRKRGFLFRLFDPPKRIKEAFVRSPKRRQAEPRIHFFDYDPRNTWLRFFGPPQPATPAPAPEVEEKVDDGTVNAIHLCRRLCAIVDALEDIPRQARRYARWRDTPIEDRHPQRESALRFGRPPGFRKRPIYEVDRILAECHWLARNVMPQLDDTS